MSTLLDIHVLPSGKRSRTRAVRESFLEAYREANDGHRIIERDLVADHAELPAFDEWDIQSRFEMLYGEGTLDAMGAERWEALSQATDQLHCADVVLISAPMWNFSVPWHLKRWIDAVMQPRLTFELRGGELVGLLSGRKAVVIVTRDGIYPPGTEQGALDFQLPYLRTVLGFMGLDPIHEIVAEPMAFGGAEVADHAFEEAVAAARALGSSI